MRLTRAAQRAQQNADEPPPTDATDDNERNPLIEISPNASPEQAAPVEEPPKKTPARSKSKKGGKKGAKAKKGKVVDEEPEQEQIEAVLEDEAQNAEVTTNDVTVEDKTKQTPEDQHTEDTPLDTTADTVSSHVAPNSTNEEGATSPPPKAVRLTRRQLAKQEEELRQSHRSQSRPRTAAAEPATEHVAQAPVEQTEEEVLEEPTAQDDTPTVQEEAHVEVEEMSEDNSVEKQPEVEQQPSTVSVDPVLEETAPAAQVEEVVEASAEPELQCEQAQQPQDSAEHVSEELQAIATLESQPKVSAPSVEVTSEPEPKTLATERPSESSRTPVISRTSSRRASRSPSKSPMRIEESIEALDALEEALENVGKAVSHFDQSTADQSPRKKTFPKEVNTPGARGKTPRKTPLATRVSRAPTAAPKSMKPTTTSLARASSVRVAPAKDLRKGSTDTVDYLASKRRPVSVSFPTPPPPPKGRAPTKPTFQLSSDAVAAKLRAQKEERQKREAEGVVPKQRPISMPPVPKSTKAPTKANFQLPGEAIAAKLKAQKEERLKREAESAQGEKSKPRPVSISMPPITVKSSKPPTKPNFQLPGEAVAAKLKAQREERQKREEEAEAAKKAAASKARPPTVRKPVALPTRELVGVSIPPPPPKSDSLQLPPQRSTSTTSKRNSIQLSRSTSVSTTASNRSSLGATKSTVTPVDAVQQKIKGREVFNRDKMEKEAKDRERREKEEAAKQARAQAAERGRIASREWAEKQRKKMQDAVRAKAGAA
jgi:hypothetical protein